MMSRREIKRLARNALNRPGVCLILALALMICVLVYMTVEITGSLAFTAFTGLNRGTEAAASAVITAIMIILMLGLLFPLIFGFISLARSAVTDDEVRLSGLFVCFSSRKTYFQTIGAAAVAWLPWIICYELFEWFKADIFALTDNLDGFAKYSAVAVIYIGVATAFFILFFISGFIFPIASVRPGESVIASIRASRGKLCKIFVFNMSFFPWILLSVATVGVLFLVFTIPYYTISYLYFSAQLRGEELTPAPGREVTFNER